MKSNSELHRIPSTTVETYTSPKIPTVYKKGSSSVSKIDELYRKSSGPLLWGKPFWFTLHFGALNYPDNPTDEMIKMNVGFISGIPVMLPCDTCKNHADKYITERRKYLYNISSSKEKLFKFYWEFHNNVNKGNGKRQISLTEAYDIFENRPRDAL